MAGGFKIFLKKCVENEVNQKLPFVREAFNSASNIDEIVALDQLLEASLSNHVANRFKVIWFCFEVDS